MIIYICIYFQYVMKIKKNQNCQLAQITVKVNPYAKSDKLEEYRHR